MHRKDKAYLDDQELDECVLCQFEWAAPTEGGKDRRKLSKGLLTDCSTAHAVFIAHPENHGVAFKSKGSMHKPILSVFIGDLG